MRKFKVINGGNVTSISNRSGEIRRLELEINKKTNRTDRDLVTYAYHFVRLGDLLLAQKYLNMLRNDYFDAGVYKDLSRALLVWSVVVVTGAPLTREIETIYEYFVILKQAQQMFEEVNFETKSGFRRFKKQFDDFTNLAST